LWPTLLLRWALVAHKAAISDIHVDGEGLATHVQIILGRKLWFVVIEERFPTANGWERNVDWQVLDLKPGDDL
jgi:hypothetical protein